MGDKNQHQRGDNRVNYDWREVKIPDQKKLKEKYNAVCRRKMKVTEEWKTLAAMLNIRKPKDFLL
jgi:hypothetical protein